MKSLESSMPLPESVDPWSRRPGAIPFFILLGVSWLLLLVVVLNRPTVLDRVDPAQRAATLADRRLDLNRASAAEMEALPLIGPALAGRIVMDRETNGRFQSVDDLRRVNGIGPRIVAIIESHVCVRSPQEG